ncbi:unnamed protein product [Arctia plantaginis]|uniref:C-type lectin domain-containing protein n=1 Tax=Arctia plantaginis TaxID=874455 RepID=A0A8S1BGG9_ARCPL|nr:unnamed protein product [Arctia plantaginis]CAB3257639.1 unnamed protein product [Arctia plantaginis]
MKYILNLVVTIFCFPISESVKFRCDYRHTYLGWFKYHEMPATWFDARLLCHLEGAILASPTTPEMKTYMLQSFCKPQIFTGIHATLTKVQFHSVDGVPFDLIPHEWAPLEPDNKNNAESCIALHSDGKFSDVRCDEPRPYICFRPHSNTEVNICGTPDPEYHFESQTNKCYKFHTKPRTFKRANFACSAEGGHLAIINNEDEAKVIRDIYTKYPASKMIGNFWKDVAFVGMYNWGESADWTTIHGQSLQEAGYAKFSPGEPNNATEGEYCGSVYRNAMFDDLWCEKHFAFICEKKPDYPPVCDSSEERPFHTPVCDNDVRPESNTDDQIDFRSDGSKT